MCFMLSGFACVYTVRCIIPIELQRLLSSLWLSRVCTCVCVCLFVVFCHSVHLYPEIIIIYVGTYVFTATRKTLYIGIIIAIFAEDASFRSYGRRHLLAPNATNRS